jgi:hypothetical protein
VFTRPWHGRRDAAVLHVHLGRTDLVELGTAVEEILADRAAHVVIVIEGFEYFDLDSLGQLTAIADRPDGRVEIFGLDLYGVALAGELGRGPDVVDIRPRAERAVVLLGQVAVVTCIVDGHVLDDAELFGALTLARQSRRNIVTIDVRNVAELSPAQSLAIAELSADLFRELRQLILVNAGSTVARQLKRAGLSGGLRLSVDDFI